jgi:hypothetical protein
VPKVADKSHQSLRNGTLANKNMNSLINQGKPLTEQRPSIGSTTKAGAINSADQQRKKSIRDELPSQLYFIGNS